MKNLIALLSFLLPLQAFAGSPVIHYGAKDVKLIPAGEMVYSDGTLMNLRPSRGWEVKEHFIMQDTTNGSGGMFCDGNPEIGTSVAGHHGIMNGSTGGTDTGFTGCSYGNEHIVVGEGRLYFEAMVSIPTLSTALEEFSVHCGFNDNAWAQDGTDGCWFVYDRPTYGDRWAIECQSNDTSTAKNLNGAGGCVSNTITAGGWDKLSIDINAAGTSVAFKIDGVSTGCSITTNIPTGASRTTGISCGLTKSVGTTARKLYMDYIWAVGAFTTEL